MSKARWNVPFSWEWSEAKNIAQIFSGGTPKNSKEAENYSDSGFAWITPADLSGYSGSTISQGKRSLSEVGLANSSAKILPKGSVLYSSRAPIGYCVIAENEITTNQGFKSFVPYGGIDPRYLRYYLLSSKSYVESQSSGTTFLELSSRKAGELMFPIAPLNEQKRIADKIDFLLSKIYEARNALISIPGLINQYRQSVLEAAFNGELTADWRKNTCIGSSAELLDEIIRARKELWESSKLDEFQVNGTLPKTNKWKEKYTDPILSSKLDVSEKFEKASVLGKWESVPLEALVDPISNIPYGIIKTGQDIHSGVPTVRAGDIKSYRIDKSSLKMVDEAISNKYDRTKLKGGEVLLSIRGTVGNAAVASNELRGCNISREVAMISVLKGVNANYIAYFLSSPQARSYLRKHTKGIAQQGINLSDLRSLPTPLPSFEEQEVISMLISKQFQEIDVIQNRIESELVNLTSLNQSILSKAFRGELVPQDPNDEPAKKLLESIKIKGGKKGKDTGRSKRIVNTHISSKVKRMIISVIDALKASETPLTSQELLRQAGYPTNASTDQIETFFLDIRSSLNANKITRNRIGNDDVFDLVR